MIFHLFLVVMLFVTSVVIFSVEISLRKLFGVIPVAASFFFMYCWYKVYELFSYMSLFGLGGGYCDVHSYNVPTLPAYCLPLPVPVPHDAEDGGDQVDTGPGPGTEFYPVDPLSRGMMDRLVVINRSMYLCPLP